MPSSLRVVLKQSTAPCRHWYVDLEKLGARLTVRAGEPEFCRPAVAAWATDLATFLGAEYAEE